MQNLGLVASCRGAFFLNEASASVVCGLPEMFVLAAGTVVFWPDRQGWAPLPGFGPFHSLGIVYGLLLPFLPA